jgi:hypothetical protein
MIIGDFVIVRYERVTRGDPWLPPTAEVTLQQISVSSCVRPAELKVHVELDTMQGVRAAMERCEEFTLMLQPKRLATSQGAAVDVPALGAGQCALEAGDAESS